MILLRDVAGVTDVVRSPNFVRAVAGATHRKPSEDVPLVEPPSRRGVGPGWGGKRGGGVVTAVDAVAVSCAVAFVALQPVPSNIGVLFVDVVFIVGIFMAATAAAAAAAVSLVDRPFSVWMRRRQHHADVQLVEPGPWRPGVHHWAVRGALDAQRHRHGPLRRRNTGRWSVRYVTLLTRELASTGPTCTRVLTTARSATQRSSM